MTVVFACNIRSVQSLLLCFSIITMTRDKMADYKRRSRFKPCIDLHDGKVKQIVGGTLSDDNPGALETNFIARSVCRPSSMHVT